MPLQRKRPLRLPVPSWLIVGDSSAGKTTFIRQLLRQKPSTEAWAVLINATGSPNSIRLDWNTHQSAAGIVTVRELFGGCLCCDLALLTSSSIAQLIRQARPDRLIIEASAAAKHEAIQALLTTNEHLRQAVDLRAIVCCVDLTTLVVADGVTENCIEDKQALVDHHGGRGKELGFRADYVVGTKADMCTPSAVERFLRWGEALQRDQGTKAYINAEESVTPIDVGIIAR
jgi:G3E family GTPase